MVAQALELSRGVVKPSKRELEGDGSVEDLKGIETSESGEERVFSICLCWSSLQVVRVVVSFIHRSLHFPLNTSLKP